MQTISVDGLLFDFDDDWKITKYDDWKFYKNFCSVGNGMKAVDLLAISPESHLYLIEVKDYRFHRRQKSAEINDEMCLKVVDTLAGLLPAKLNSDIPAEQIFATAALACNKIRVVLHLEQATEGSRLSPRRFRSEDIADKMRKQLRTIDRRAVASDRRNMSRMNWTCRSEPIA